MSTPATNVPPPRKEGGLPGIFAFLLGVLVVALVLIFAAIYVGGRYLARNVNVSVRERGEAKSVQIRTPVGEVNIQAGKGAAEERIGLPVYPGAVREKEGASVSVDVAGEKGGSVLAQKYETPDPLDQVVEWYRKELGPDFSLEHEKVSRHKREHEGIVFKSETEERHRIVAIGRKGNVTQIALVVVTEKKPQ